MIPYPAPLPIPSKNAFPGVFAKANA